MMNIDMEKNSTVLLFLLCIKLLVRIRFMEASRPAKPENIFHTLNNGQLIEVQHLFFPWVTYLHLIVGLMLCMIGFVFVIFRN